MLLIYRVLQDIQQGEISLKTWEILEFNEKNNNRDVAIWKGKKMNELLFSPTLSKRSDSLVQCEKTHFILLFSKNGAVYSKHFMVYPNYFLFFLYKKIMFLVWFFSEISSIIGWYHAVIFLFFQFLFVSCIYNTIISMFFMYTTESILNGPLTSNHCQWFKGFWFPSCQIGQYFPEKLTENNIKNVKLITQVDITFFGNQTVNHTDLTWHCIWPILRGMQLIQFQIECMQLLYEHLVTDVK